MCVGLHRPLQAPIFGAQGGCTVVRVHGCHVCVVSPTQDRDQSTWSGDRDNTNSCQNQPYTLLWFLSQHFPLLWYTQVQASHPTTHPPARLTPKMTSDSRNVGVACAKQCCAHAQRQERHLRQVYKGSPCTPFTPTKRLDGRSTVAIHVAIPLTSFAGLACCRTPV